MAQQDLLAQLKIDADERESHDEQRRYWPFVVLGIVLLALAGAAFWWWSSARAVSVQTVTATAPAQNQGAAAVLQATGYVTARRKATVSAQIIGTLTDVLIEEGDHVQKGQVLARLEDRSQKARLQAAKASARAAAAHANEVRTKLAQAKRENKRKQRLVQRHLVSAEDAEQARTRVATLRAGLGSAEAQTKAAKAQEAVAQVNFDYTVVRAPFDGVITQKTAQVGEIIAPAAAGGGFTRTGVGTIVDMDSLEIEVDVNEAYIGRVQPGMAAEAVLDAYPDWTIPAHVIAIIPAANRAKATVKVRVAMDSKDARIVPNMGVRVSFLQNDTGSAATDTSAPTGVLVPASAIVLRNGQQVVFVVDEGTAQSRAVTPDPKSSGDLRRIAQGLQPGTQIIKQPSAELTDGTQVEVTTQ